MSAADEKRADEVSAVRRVTVAGMAVNVAISVAKGVVGLVGSSQALLADAVHSVSDLVTDVAVLLGVRYWSAPADDEHPYGHGKIQALVTLFIALALGLVAWKLAEGAYQSIRSPTTSHPGPVAAAVAAVSIVLKEWLYRWTHAVARQVKSPALDANAWHHRSDAFSSIPVAVAVVAEWLFPSLWWADEVGAFVVVLFIAHVAWEIAKPALQELVDAGIREQSGAVAALARSVPGVLEVHNVRARRCGSAYLADLHVQVDARLSVAEGHAIAHEVKDALLASHLEIAEAVIHVEPRDVRAIVSLGSNIEPRADYLAKALAAVGEFPCTHFTKASSVIETEPVDVPGEFAHLKFLNQVALFETALSAEDFARRLHALEDALGRVRTVRNGPRTIDLDLIDFGGERVETSELTLPHPRARERAFVTEPLAELGIRLGGPGNA